MSHDQTRQAALAYFDTLGTGEADAFVALFSPDAYFEDPVAGPGPALDGHDGLRKFHRGLRRVWQSLRMDVGDVFVRGSRAAVRWRAEGVSASGKAIAFEGINVIAVDDQGRISRLEGFWDVERVMGQMA